MNTKNTELDKFFTYRLIQVLYYSSLIIGQILILFITYNFLPPQIFHKQIIYDQEKSTFTCANGKKYMFSNTIGTYYTQYIWQSDIVGNIENNKNKLKIFCDSSFNYSNYLKQRENSEREFNEKYGAISISEEEFETAVLNDFIYSGKNRLLIKPKNIKNVKNIDILYKKYEKHWLQLILKLISTMLIYYLVLNILRETGIYLCTGRQFTWSWLKIHNKRK